MYYDVTVERRQGGKVLNTYTTVMEGARAPKIGEGRNFLTDPVITEVITAVTPRESITNSKLKQK